MQRPHVMSGGRYPVLRALAIIYVVGAALAILAALIGGIWSLVGAGNAWLPMGRSPNMGDRVISCIIMLTGGFFAALSMLAIAEVLKLFIDVEHNTRMSGGRTTVSVAPGAAAISTGGDGGRVNRLDALDEETAEAALIRGH